MPASASFPWCCFAPPDRPAWRDRVAEHAALLLVAANAMALAAVIAAAAAAAMAAMAWRGERRRAEAPAPKAKRRERAGGRKLNQLDGLHTRQVVQAMVALLPLPVVLFDEEQVLRASERACSLFGYAFGDLMGKRMNVLLPSHVTEGGAQALVAAASENDAGLEVIAKHANGAGVPVLLTARILEVDPGERLMLVVFEDLSVKQDNMALQDMANLLTDRAAKMHTVLTQTVPPSLLQSLIREQGEIEAKVGLGEEPPQRSPHVRKHKDVCIAFLDIKGFSAFCKAHKPTQVASRMHKTFTLLDRLVKSYGVAKMRTVGDGYLATKGIFEDFEHPRGRSPADIVRDAGAMLLFALDAIHSCSLLGLSIRCGLHRGEVLSGVVGQESAQFDIFGHEANYAARLEQNCELSFVNTSVKFFKNAKIAIPMCSRELITQETTATFKNIGEETTVLVKLPRGEGRDAQKVSEDWLLRAREELLSGLPGP